MVRFPPSPSRHLFRLRRFPLLLQTDGTSTVDVPCRRPLDGAACDDFLHFGASSHLHRPPIPPSPHPLSSPTSFPHSSLPTPPYLRGMCDTWPLQGFWPLLYQDTDEVFVINISRLRPKQANRQNSLNPELEGFTVEAASRTGNASMDAVCRVKLCPQSAPPPSPTQTHVSNKHPVAQAGPNHCL